MEGGIVLRGGRGVTSAMHIWKVQRTTQSENCLAPRKAAKDAAFIAAKAAAAGDDEDGAADGDLGDNGEWTGAVRNC